MTLKKCLVFLCDSCHLTQVQDGPFGGPADWSTGKAKR